MSDERKISLRSLYFKYFWMIFICMTLLALISIAVAFTMNAATRKQALDRANVQSLNLIKASLDNVLTDTSGQALKLAGNSEIRRYRLVDRDYTYDYDAMLMRLNCIKYLHLALRSELDYEIAIYTGVNGYLLSSRTGAQLLRLTVNSDVDDIYRRNYEKGRTLFWEKRELQTKPLSNKMVMTYFCGIDENCFIIVNVDMEKLRALVATSDAAADRLIMVLDDKNRCLFGSENRLCGVGAEEVILDGEIPETGGGGFLYTFEDQEYYAYMCAAGIQPMRYMLLVPIDVYQMEELNLVRSIAMVILGSLLAAMILAAVISRRVFRPIGVILDFIDNKAHDAPAQTGSYEVQYILLHILEAYQNNVALKKQQLEDYDAMRKARVRALQQQITPHFLYNTLQAILWMNIEDMGYRESRSSAAIKSLSHMSRFCMEGEGVCVHVDEEIAYVEEFLSLMKLRYGEKIKWRVERDEAAGQCLIPRLSIQPLVENSVKYSLCKMENGMLVIRIKISGAKLTVCVEDNGPGFAPEEREALEMEFKHEFYMHDRHVGLTNLNQRLKLIYGADAGLAIKKHDGLTGIEFSVPTEDDVYDSNK